MTMYATGNPPTKKALKERVAAGRSIEVFSAGIGSPPCPGVTTVSGPHYPQPHKWYARVELDADGYIVKVVS